LLIADKTRSEVAEEVVEDSQEGDEPAGEGSGTKPKEEVWCQKRYEKEKDDTGKKHSAGSLWMFHLCGFSFPPVEMVGAESLTQVGAIVVITSISMSTLDWAGTDTGKDPARMR
jgi:hypothetical protein